VQCDRPLQRDISMAIKITVEGDDKDELVAQLQAALEMLGGEAGEEAEEEEAEEEEETEEEETEEEESEEEDPSDALRAEIKKKVLLLTKKPGGAEKVRKAFAIAQAKKLDQIKDNMLAKVDKALGIVKK
jgi:hypothetical protein